MDYRNTNEIKQLVQRIETKSIIESDYNISLAIIKALAKRYNIKLTKEIIKNVHEKFYDLVTINNDISNYNRFNTFRTLIKLFETERKSNGEALFAGLGATSFYKDVTEIIQKLKEIYSLDKIRK